MKLLPPLVMFLMLFLTGMSYGQGVAPIHSIIVTPGKRGPVKKYKAEMDLPVSPPQFKMGPGGWYPVPEDEEDDEPVSEPEEDPTPEEEDDPRDTPPPILYGEELDAEADKIVYVLDISCSMGGDRSTYTDPLSGALMEGNRLERAKAEVARSILGLAENFEFNVVFYDCVVEQCFKENLVDATDANKMRAVLRMKSFNPRGGTGTGPATSYGLRLGAETVALLTDGAPNCGATSGNDHRIMIRVSNFKNATINVFGIGAHGSLQAWCRAVAADNGGNYYDVP